ncbi:MAG: hypothetical protein EON49_04440 [Acidovorax sp.]|nr:MAG: hypothetical protein EON49_04440 [Acidovorax sp.]
MFLFFSVARSASTSQAERANEAHGTPGVEVIDIGSASTSQAERANEAHGTPGVEVIDIGSAAAAVATDPSGEKMPTDKLVDVSPMALRMSSPFNSGYWLSAA